MFFRFILLLSLTIPTLSFAQITEREELVSVFDAFQKTYQDEIEELNAVVEFNTPVPNLENFWWNLEELRASVAIDDSKTPTKYHVYVFGGLARLKGMTKDGLAITICHEFGHFLGGEPKKFSGSTTEGMSDYYSTKTCLQRVFKNLPKIKTRTNTEKEVAKCKSHYSDSDDLDFCLRAMIAMDSHLLVLKGKDKEKLGLWDKDPTKVSSIDRNNYFYPSKKCRVQTSVAGILKKPAPSCWFTPNDNWNPFFIERPKKGFRFLCDEKHWH